MQRERRSGPVYQAVTLGLVAACVAGHWSLAPVTAQTRPQVTSVRLYVLDCGVLVRGEPTAYAHPKGAHLWDVGIIPDA